jgi:hypothetical protein
MEVTTLVNWKSGKIVNRQLSPLARVYRRNNYIPSPQNLQAFKGIINRVLAKNFELSDDDSSLESSKRPGFSSPQIKKKKIPEISRFSNKFPGFKVKRTKSKPNKEIASAMKVRKVTLVQPNKVKKYPRFKNENSNYTSYSNIYKNLLEKVPLIC